jgi:hypothetical protein
MKAWVLVLFLGGCYLSHDGAPRDGSSTRRDAGALRDGQMPGRDAHVLRDGEVPPDVGTLVDAEIPDGGRRDAGPPFDGGTPPDSGMRSLALSFASGDFLLIADDPTLELVDTWTFELWMRPRGDGTIAIKGDRATGSYHYFVAYQAGEVVVGWNARGLDRHLRAPAAPMRWTHVAAVGVATPGGVSLRLLVDGILAATGMFPNDLRDSLNGSNFLIGGGWDGDVDEVRLWAVTRADSDIAEASTRRFAVALPGMEMYLPLEERGQIALDRSLRGHDGVLGNLVTPDPSDPAWIFDGPIP